MEIVTEAVSAYFDSATSNSWNWFDSLNREEWMVVLGVCAACGFLCMRGMGIKK